MNEFLALRYHLTYLRRVYLVHLASNKQTTQSYFLVIFFIDLQAWGSKFVEKSNSNVLRIFCDFFMKREDPLDGMFSVFLVNRIDGMSGGVGRLREGWKGRALLKKFG